MNDSSTELLHQQADRLLNNQQLIDARAVYDRICAVDRGDAKAFMMRGALDGEMGRVSEAIASLEEAVRIDPDYPDAYHVLAHLLQHCGKPTEARNALRRAVEADPNFTEAWLMLSGLAGQLQDYGEAETTARKALQLEPALLDARINLANALVEQAKDAEAVHELRLITAADAANALAWSRLGSVLVRLERADEAADALEKALALDPSDVSARVALGIVHRRNEHFDDARQHLRMVLERNPDNEKAWAVLSECSDEAHWDGHWDDILAFCTGLSEKFTGNRHILLNAGYALERLDQLDEAKARYQSLTRDYPEWGDGWNRLGLLYTRVEEYHNATTCLRKAVDLGVDSPLTLCMFGATLRYYGSFLEAEQYCQRAMEKAPEIVPVYIHLGMVQTLMGKLDEAAETYRKGLEQHPDNLTLTAGVADVLERQGKHEEAASMLEPRLEEAAEGIAQIASVYAKISKHAGDRGRAMDVIERILETTTLMRQTELDLHFRVADIHDSSGEYDRAFEHYRKANDLYELVFDEDAHITYIDGLIQAFDRARMERLSGLGNPSCKPILIVGMPRSGSSLVEQILASHPNVHGAGELMELAAVEKGLGFDSHDSSGHAERLEQLTAPEIQAYARRYLTSLECLSDGEPLVTDKLPYNFLRLGLFQILFPNARVIHTVRDPRDSCLSCYFHDFLGVHPHAYDLHGIGVFCREYRKLMKHWHDVLSIPILDVVYEETVSDIEGMSRRILDFCGLGWDERVLQFHKSERFVRTASYDQVRRPIYNTSLQRWRNYEKWIAPLESGLGL